MKARTILIVDDEQTQRYALRRALEGKYRIVEAEGGAAARLLLEREQPALVLLDLVMPEEDGMRFLRWMRSNGYRQPVVVLTALDTAATAVEAMKLGATDYLVKGCDIEELRRRIGRCPILVAPRGPGGAKEE